HAPPPPGDPCSVMLCAACGARFMVVNTKKPRPVRVRTGRGGNLAVSARTVRALHDHLATRQAVMMMVVQARSAICHGAKTNGRARAPSSRGGAWAHG